MLKNSPSNYGFLIHMKDVDTGGVGRGEVKQIYTDGQRMWLRSAHTICGNDTCAENNGCNNAETGNWFTKKNGYRWWTMNTGTPVGTIIAWPTSANMPPAKSGRWLLCDGSSFNIETYPELYEILNSDRVPNLNGRFLEGTTGTPGELKGPGLPNITGGTNSLEYNGLRDSTHPNGDSWGAFSNSIRWSVNGVAYTCALQLLSDQSGIIPFFDASLSNSLYGSSETVQPASYTVRFLIKAGY